MRDRLTMASRLRRYVLAARTEPVQERLSEVMAVLQLTNAKRWQPWDAELEKRPRNAVKIAKGTMPIRGYPNLKSKRKRSAQRRSVAYQNSAYFDEAYSPTDTYPHCPGRRVGA